MTRSRFARLNLMDVVFGVLWAGAGATIDFAIEHLSNGTFDKRQLTIAAIVSGVGYLKVKFFANSDGKLYKKEQK